MSEAAVKEEINPEEELSVAAGDMAVQDVELYDGTKVACMRCKVRHAARIARLANKVLTALGVETMQSAASIDLNNPQMLISVVELAENDLIECIAALTDMDQESILDLDLDDMITVMAKLVEMNRSFFLKRVRAALQRLTPASPEGSSSN